MLTAQEARNRMGTRPDLMEAAEIAIRMGLSSNKDRCIVRGYEPCKHFEEEMRQRGYSIWHAANHWDGRHYTICWGYPTM